MAEGFNLHVVAACESSGESPCRSASRRGMEDWHPRDKAGLDFGTATKAILVLSELQHTDRAAQIVQELRLKCRSIPAIVMLIDSQGEVEPCHRINDVLRAQLRLDGAGVDDIIVKHGGRSEVKTDLAVSIVRAGLTHGRRQVRHGRGSGPGPQNGGLAEVVSRSLQLGGSSEIDAQEHGEGMVSLPSLQTAPDSQYNTVDSCLDSVLVAEGVCDSASLDEDHPRTSFQSTHTSQVRRDMGSPRRLGCSAPAVPPARAAMLLQNCTTSSAPQQPQRGDGRGSDSKATSASFDCGMQVGPCRIDNCLGKGKFGRVYLATHVESGQQEAVKVVPKNSSSSLASRCLETEARVLGLLTHENIVRVLGAGQGPDNFFLRMEVVGKLNLFRVLGTYGPLTQEGSQKVISQLTSAIAYCHGKKIAHRDVKPENIGVVNGGLEIKLLDFGFAVNSDRPCRDSTGTIPFAAPEVMTACADARYLPAPTDIWSCGILLLELLSGVGKLEEEAARESNSLQNTAGDPNLEVANMLKARPQAIGSLLRRHAPEKPPPDLLQLLEETLRHEPSERWTAQQVLTSGWLIPPLDTPEP